MGTSRKKGAAPEAAPEVSYKPCVCICVHDDHWFLNEVISSFAAAGPCYVFVSRLAWNGSVGNWERTVEHAEMLGAEVVLGDWPDEEYHRSAAYAHAQSLGFNFIFVPDSDEIIEAKLLDTLIQIGKFNLGDRVYVHMDTYWHSPEYVIRPREALTPVIAFRLSSAEYWYCREFRGGRGLVLSPEHGVLHHLSYALPEERIRRKLECWGHRNQVLPDWLESVFLAWREDKLMRNLHPTKPEAYGFAERSQVAPELLGIPLSDKLAQLSKQKLSISVVIPLHGGIEDITACLESLQLAREVIYEVIVIDNASKDSAAEVAEMYDFVKLVRNAENVGFPRACNQGAKLATGDAILFLNSDTVAPKIALSRLIESLESSGSVAAVGPYTNCASGFQELLPTYTSLSKLDLFAEDFAIRSGPDLESDMLVGFCMLVRRTAFEEVGGFDEQFGIGMFEDNDLSYRLRRNGYKLLIANRAFIHHSGSKTFARLPGLNRECFSRNRLLFERKWSRDVETGYASHLSGMSAGRIIFDPAKRPDVVCASLRAKVERADISLCMIVRNEERVLAECLESAKPFFNQIVVLDTGSSDSTVLIAESFGAEVHHFPWSDSFSEARNHSISYARGKWIFWMDADDTLPFASGTALLEAALNAPSNVFGFIVPVRFTDEGPAAGTTVDHVKLFRTGKGIHFEGRIHEQNLWSIREADGEVARCGGYVLHSGYDISISGQAAKRQRDEHLLKLDLQERPDHPFVLFNLGMTAHFNGEYSTAIEWLEKSIANALPTESHLRKAFSLLASCKRQLGQLEDAVEEAKKGLATVGDDPELHFIAGTVLADLGRYSEALNELEQIQADVLANTFSSIDVGIVTFKKLHNLGTVHLNLGNYAEAKRCLSESLAMAPTFGPSREILFWAALERGDFDTAKAMLDGAFQQDGPTEWWATAASAFAGKTMGLGAETAVLRDCLVRNPQLDGVRRVLARHLIQRGLEVEAIRHWRILDDSGCPEAAYLLGVAEIRKGDFKGALGYMKKSQERNPGHQQTLEQLERLEKATASL